MRRIATCTVACLMLLAACDRTEGPDPLQTASTATPAAATATATATANSSAPAPTEPAGSATPAPDGTRPPAPARTPSPTPTRSPGARSISGVFTDSRPTVPTQTRPLPVPPASPFRPHDGLTVTLYDVAAQRETFYGKGGFVSFSPDGKHLAWAAGDATEREGMRELTVLDLATRQTRTLGPARTTRWLDARTLLVHLPDLSNEMATVDLETGQRVPVDPNNRPGDAPLPVEAAGYRFESLGWTSEYPFWRSLFRMTDQAGRLAPLEFEAHSAVFADDGVLFLATSPTSLTPPAAQGPHLESGASNIFSVDIETGVATFVATAQASAPNWPFRASSRYVAWTDRYCDLSDASDDRLNVIDRRTGAVTTFEGADWIAGITPRGELALGAFGARTLLEIETAQYTFVMPGKAGGSPGGSDVTWSPDYRYAARGFSFGHGGLCG